jgi:hypothetical protein
MERRRFIHLAGLASAGAMIPAAAAHPLIQLSGASPFPQAEGLTASVTA